MEGEDDRAREGEPAGGTPEDKLDKVKEEEGTTAGEGKLDKVKEEEGTSAGDTLLAVVDFVRERVGLLREEKEIPTLISLPGPRAIIDTAAAQALIGELDLRVLEQHHAERGFKVLFRTSGADQLPVAKGVGGASRPVGKAFVPVAVPTFGVIEFLVLP